MKIDKDKYFENIQQGIVSSGFTHKISLVTWFTERKHVMCTSRFKDVLAGIENPFTAGMPEMHFQKDKMLQNLADKIIVETLELSNTFPCKERVLFTMSHLMWDQQGGKEGILSVTEYDNSFFIKDFVLKIGYIPPDNKFMCDAIPYDMERGKNDFIFYPTYIGPDP